MKGSGQTVKKKDSVFKEIWKNKAIYMIMLPGIAWFIIFAYGPMSGLQLAFKEYSTKLGIWGSHWCGMENFQYVFRDPSFLRSVGTTLWINAGRLLFQFPIPIILALLFNELRLKRYKKVVQTVLTFPQFLSWVIVASIVINILSYDGLVNSIIAAFGGETINFMGSAGMFQPLLYITEDWKSAGWGAIIYMAAISGIDVDQYEAADLDGATKWQQFWKITIPNIAPSIFLVLIMTTIGSLKVFGQVKNLTNGGPGTASYVMVFYIYEMAFRSYKFGYASAISVVLFLMIVGLTILQWNTRKRWIHYED